jgi:hypothetical protein
MALCKSSAMSVIGASFNGTNLDVVTKASSFNLGGWIGTDGVMTVAGRYSQTSELMPSEVTLSVVNNGQFTPSLFDGCGDLIISASTGKRYLIKNASLSETITYDDSKASLELKFKGDVGIEYS